MRIDLLILIAAAVVALWLVYRRDERRHAADRRGIYDNCLHLFEAAEIAQDGVGFPVLSGRYRGRAFKLEPIADHIVFRKVPSLWLRATVFGAVPYAGAFDFLARPFNSEFWSPLWQFEHVLPIPPGWPEFAACRTDSPQEIPPVETLSRHAVLFDDPKMKELLVTPRGVRLVYQADQGQRSYYLVLRQLVFENAQLDPGLVSSLLDAAIAIHDDVAATRN